MLLKILTQLRSLHSITLLVIVMSLFSSVADASDEAMDEEKPITDEEINAYMVRDYGPGCCLIGTLVGTAASFLLGCAAGVYVYDEIDEEMAWLAWAAIWGVGTGVSALVSMKVGEDIDRDKAIELVQEERRTGVKPPRPKRKFLPGVLIAIGVAGAITLVLGAISE
jgi:hypothetical protein